MEIRPNGTRQVSSSELGDQRELASGGGGWYVALIVGKATEHGRHPDLKAATSSVGSFWIKPTVSLIRHSLLPLHGAHRP